MDDMHGDCACNYSYLDYGGGYYWVFFVQHHDSFIITNSYGVHSSLYESPMNIYGCVTRHMNFLPHSSGYFHL